MQERDRRSPSLPMHAERRKGVRGTSAGEAKQGVVRRHRRGLVETKHAGTEVDRVENASFRSVCLRSQIKYISSCLTMQPGQSIRSAAGIACRDCPARVQQVKAYYQQACIAAVVAALAQQQSAGRVSLRKADTRQAHEQDGYGRET